MNIFKKWLSIVLAALMLLSVVTGFASCATSDETPDAGTQNTDTNAETSTGEVDNRFTDVNYGGREFRIYTSAHGGESSSNLLIEGTGKTGGGLVNDAVVKRNMTVEDLLGVKLVFTQCDLSYGAIAGDIRRFTQSGDDEFDLVINDNYDFTTLLIEGNFRNTLDKDCVFDFEREYWYQDFMADLRLMDGYQYILAGDYFIDVLRTAHLLLVNKDLYKDFYQSSADELYDLVINYEWTHEKLLSIITDQYIDRNNDGKKSAGDRFGYVDTSMWGGSIGYSASGTTNFISRDEDGIPTITIQEGDRSNQLAEAITALFNNDSSLLDDTIIAPLDAFVNNDTLVAGGLMLRDLESSSLRAMESDAAVLPLPMLFASDKKYITATHDTTEMGAILITSTDLSFISTVVEVLNRETANILIPKYYKESLQVQCVDDEKAASMIDIIHDNFDNAFILAYNVPLGNKILQAFYTCAQDNRQFSAVFPTGVARGTNKTLETKIKQFRKMNNAN